jgi:hypothetical protein
VTQTSAGVNQYPVPPVEFPFSRSWRQGWHPAATKLRKRLNGLQLFEVAKNMSASQINNA